MTAETVPQPIENLEREALPIVEQANALVVFDATSFDEAGEKLVGIKGIQKKIHASCDPVVAATNAAHKAATKQRRELLDPLQAAERLVKGLMGDYVEEVEKRRRKEDARLAAEAAAMNDDDRIEEAAALEAAGEHDAAEAVLNDTAVAPPVTSEAVPKTAGVSYRTAWCAVVVSKDLLIRAVADGTVPSTMLEPSMTSINQFARATKGEVQVPGLMFESKKIMSAKTG